MSAFMILADGYEEIEVFTVLDILRRAGVKVDTAGLVSTVIEGAHKIKTIADKRLTEINTANYDMMIIPGGPAYKRLINSNSVLEMIKQMNAKKKFIAAICAAPLVLAKAGVIDDRIVTVYPGLEKQVPRPREGKVIIDGNIITAKGPGAAMLFGLKLVEIFVGKPVAEKVKRELVVD